MASVRAPSVRGVCGSGYGQPVDYRLAKEKIEQALTKIKYMYIKKGNQLHAKIPKIKKNEEGNPNSKSNQKALIYVHIYTHTYKQSSVQRRILKQIRNQAYRICMYIHTHTQRETSQGGEVESRSRRFERQCVAARVEWLCFDPQVNYSYSPTTVIFSQGQSSRLCL